MARKIDTESSSAAFSSTIRRHADFARAREYINANLTNPIMLSDVCNHANVNARTLQRLFKHNLGFSPTQYILIRRLNTVRRELMESNAELGRVTTIALNHGFNHLGHFAVQYRKFFGETPRQTLHRQSPRRLRDEHLYAA